MHNMLSETMFLIGCVSGPVLWLLQCCWSQQSSPGNQCHWWHRALVAKSPSFHGLEVQWSQRHLRSGAGKSLSCGLGCDHFLHLCICFAVGRDFRANDFIFRHHSFFVWFMFCGFFTKLTILKLFFYSRNFDDGDSCHWDRADDGVLSCTDTVTH